MIGREVIKVLFIGSDSIPSACGPAYKSTHAATLTQETHDLLQALFLLLCLKYHVFLATLKESQIDED